MIMMMIIMITIMAIMMMMIIVFIFIVSYQFNPNQIYFDILYLGRLYNGKYVVT